MQLIIGCFIAFQLAETFQTLSVNDSFRCAVRSKPQLKWHGTAEHPATSVLSSSFVDRVV